MSSEQNQLSTTLTKFLIVCMFAGLLNEPKSTDITKLENCECWEDFEPEENNGIVYCRGKKHHRIFGCNEEKPPICQCLVDGTIIELDLGETNCLDVKTVNGRWCYNRAEFVDYFKRHPNRAICD